MIPRALLIVVLLFSLAGCADMPTYDQSSDDRQPYSFDGGDEASSHYPPYHSPRPWRPYYMPYSGPSDISSPHSAW